MLSSILTFAALTLPLVSCKGGGKGGGGGGGGSGGGSGGGTSIIPYVADECYTTGLSAVYMYSNGSDGRNDGPSLGNNYWQYIWDDQHHNNTINYMTTKIPTINWGMEIFDAYYNGSFSLTVTPPTSNSTFNCPELKSQTIPNMYLRLGPQSNRDINRKNYGDENSYYFQFGRSIFERDCPQTPNKAFVNFESSNDNLQQAQVWTLKQTKNGDKFDLEGSLTSNLASYNNYWNYVVNTTGTDAPYPNPVYPQIRCPRTFSLRTILANAGARMAATVTAKEAKMNFEFTDTEVGYKITGSFTGQHWEKGPKILFDKDTIQTTGEVPHVKPRVTKKSATDGFLKWVIIGVSIGVGLLAVYLIWRFFSCLASCIKCCCCCKRKPKQPKAPKSDVEQGGTFEYKQPQSHVMPVAAPQYTPVPAEPEISYQVTPAVAESYGVMGGVGYAEITAAQQDLHRQHVDLHNAKLRGDAGAGAFAESMIVHNTRVIEHWMTVRKSF
ncbi:hypothetical protein B0J11DRAFT_334744 [Dendryphion nanum]|uniref:Uncharacterized protein n=1 Tax=Dendryphion nanum TaxID=256645 RepID=A0A9P9IJ95_9PLEO|nr:hypothetical protein B0J11DRAFT_334744 [Dendryphion nanum]